MKNHTETEFSASKQIGIDFTSCRKFVRNSVGLGSIKNFLMLACRNSRLTLILGEKSLGVALRANSTVELCMGLGMYLIKKKHKQ